ncbi:hypothetical protein ACFV9C_12850 [Kribbella sp. NPDC059898]|uniref:hypothetical protein n=1 Tax=Kribbella sp. NPDC059898 TaxID=3346995 RepID=UPI00364E72D9
MSDAWTIPEFYPIGYLPNGVRLTAHGGESSDLPAYSFQRYVDLVADGSLPIRIDRVFPSTRSPRHGSSRQTRRAHRPLMHCGTVSP